MKIDAIYTERNYKKAPFWDLVHEWEDDLCKYLEVPLIYSNGLIILLNKILHKVSFLRPLSKVFRINKDKTILYFEMDASYDNPLFNNKTMVPIIVDFFVKDEDIPKFLHRHANCKAIMISSKQAYDKVISFNPQIPIFHLPLTLSDRYCNNNINYHKKYTLTLFGRQNKDSFFLNMIKRYSEENPDFEYVYQELEDMNSEKGYVYKTNKGKIIGQTNTRSEYIKLVQDTKIAIYSTPGFGGRNDTNGYNQVTPKLLEYIASQCHVILRYPNNSDTQYFELNKLSESVKDYDSFKKMMDIYINSQPNYELYKNYINKHRTSSLIKILNQIKI